MKTVTIHLHYKPLSVRAYKRTMVIRCGDKSESEALAYIHSLVKDKQWVYGMKGYVLTDANVVIEHINER